MPDLEKRKDTGESLELEKESDKSGGKRCGQEAEESPVHEQELLLRTAGLTMMSRRLFLE